MALLSITKEAIERKVADMNAALPESRVVDWGEGCLPHPTVVFLKEKPIEGQFDRARFYAQLVSACFLQADLYKGQEYQFSIGTASGPWQELLSDLESAVDAVSQSGLDAIKDYAESGYMGRADEPLE